MTTKRKIQAMFYQYQLALVEDTNNTEGDMFETAEERDAFRQMAREGIMEKTTFQELDDFMVHELGFDTSSTVEWLDWQMKKDD